MRICQEINNAQNKIKLKNNSSGITGISKNKQNGKYEAYITYDYKRRFLGYFENIEDAIEARKNAEQRYFGEYSYDKSMQISNSFRKE